MRTTMRSLVAIGAALAVLSLTAAAPALAGKGGKPQGGGASATISLVLLESTDGLAHWGQRVTFSVTTSEPQPRVNLRCYQGGKLVGQSTEGFFAGALDDQIFGLYSPQWTEGAADCTADVKTPAGSVIGSTSFHVYA